MRLTTISLALLVAHTLSLATPLVSARAEEAVDPSEPISFAKEIAPVLVANCGSCHDDRTRDGGYSVSTFANLLAPGDSGLTPVAAGDSASELLVRLRTEDEHTRMPAESPPLPADTIDQIEQWIKQGAKSDVPETKPLQEIINENEQTFAPPEHYPRPLPVSAIGITPDGKIAIAGGYAEVLFWNLDDATLLTRLRVQGRRISDIDISSDGHLLAVASGTPGASGVVELFSKDESNSWQPLWTRTMPEMPLDVAISPDCRFTLIGEASGKLRLVDNSTTQDKFLLPSHAAAITAVGWSRDSSKFYSASRDRTAKAYKTENAAITGSFAEHERVVGGIAESYNGVYTIEESGRLKNWIEGNTSHIISQKGNFPARVTKLIRHNDQLIVLEDNGLKIVKHVSEQIPDGNDEDGKPKTKWTNRFEDVNQLNAAEESLLCFTATTAETGTRILAGTSKGEILLWEPDISAEAQARIISKP